MQINNSVVNLGGMNTVQGNAFQRSVKIPGQKGKEYQDLFLKPDIDTYRSSALKASSMEFEMIYKKDGTAYGYIDKKETERLWETAKEKYKDEPFKLYAQSQNLVFSQKLKESGFFDGMSKEEAEQFEELLADITAVMNGVNRYISIGSRESTAADVSWRCYMDTDTLGSFPAPPSYEAKGELESASEALRLFCDKYVDEEHKGEFYALIDDFHAYNTEYLKDYETSSERMSRANALLYFYHTEEQEGASSEDFKRAAQEYDTRKAQASDAYGKALSAVFQRMRQSGSIHDELWDSLSLEHEKCVKETGKGTSWAGEERERKETEALFAHRKGYWEKLIKA